uniref:hypothetical protein n=1 Tax=Algoriphagus sp. TaxID=1872435 RepID=UPI00404865EE
MRIHGKLLRIFKENENLAHFLNSKPQDFYTREPRDLAYFSLLFFVFLLAKKVSSEDQDTFAALLHCAFA